MESEPGFGGNLARMMAIVGGVLIPTGLILSGIFGSWIGLLSGFIGFAVATLNSLAVLWVLKWALNKPPQVLPAVLMTSYVVRLVALFGILFGLYCAKSLNMIAILFCFLAMYIAHTAVETVYAYKSFGAVLKSSSGGRK